MKRTNNRIKQLSFGVSMLAISSALIAQTKVVVIPLFADDTPKPAPVSWQDNTAKIEIEGICSSAKFIIVKGPAVEIQVIRGFTGSGGADDHSGLSAEQPLEIETIPSSSVNPYDDCEAGIRTWMTNAPDPRAFSIISTDVTGAEVVRWNMFYFEPVSEKPGNNGGVIFTLKQTRSNDHSLAIEREPIGSTSINSLNPSTDRRVEIEGISTGLFPAVEDEDKASATLVLVYDYKEAGWIPSWVRQTIIRGTQIEGKRSVSVGPRLGSGEFTQNYFGCFPSQWSQFTGFTQYIQLKERVTLECDFSEPAS